MRYQTGPAQCLAELLHRTGQPSVLPVWVRFVAVGTVAVCQSLADFRVPSDADLYAVRDNRDAAG